jgi:hypothetical protein
MVSEMAGDMTVATTVLSFGPKRDEVTGEWRKLQNEELNDPILCG